MKAIRRTLTLAVVTLLVLLTFNIGQNAKAAFEEPAAELLSEDVETELIPLYGELVESWDVSMTEGTDRVICSVYLHPNDENAHLLVVSGEGKMKDYNAASEAPWFKAYSKTVLSVIIESGVKNVGYYAFSYCTSLTAVSLPDTLTTVGVQSFSYCPELENIDLPFGMSYIGYYAFAYCESLDRIDLNGVKRIYDGAFEGCSSLKSVTVPAKTSDIGTHTFFGCTSLAEILTEEGSSVYSSLDGNLYSADGKTLLLFAPGKVDETFAIPEGVTALGDYSFECSSLSALTVGGSVESIGTYAFRASEKLSTVTLEDGVKTVGSWAFAECPLLERVELGSVETVGAYAFAFDDALVSVTLPDSLNSLGTAAYYACEGLVNVDLGSVVTVGQFAFSKCTALVSVDLGDSLSELGASAFRGCIALSSVDLPVTLDSVGAFAFGGCTSLGDVTVRSEGFLATLNSTADGGSLLVYAENLFLPTTTATEYVSAAYPNKMPILKSGELFFLYSICSHEWTGNAKGYTCRGCELKRDAHDIASVSLTVGYDLSVSVYAYAPEGAAVRFTMNGKSTLTEGTYVESLGAWRYVFLGVTPQCMGDAITAELVFSDVTLSALENYTVLTYCNKLLAMSASDLGISEQKRAELNTLIYDLMDFGAAAQLYTGYKTASLANGGIEGGRLFHKLESTDFTLTPLSELDGVAFTSASLRYETTNRLYFKFKAPDASSVTVRVERNGDRRTYTQSDFSEQGDVFVLVSDHIYATGFDEVYTVTLIYDGVEVERLTYSVNSYVARMQDSSDPLLSALVRATYCYGISAESYATL